MLKRALSVIGCAAVALVAPQQFAMALDASGTAVAVVTATSAAGPGGDRPLEDEKPVYSGDKITTDALGRAQIVFRDDTKLVVGPNSSLTIDQFVFGNDGKASAVAMNMAKGALRFISGNSPHSVYKLKTPSASIGVRGTQFDVAIGTRGETGLLLFLGAVQICGNTGRCITVDDQCGAALALTSGAVGPITGQLNRGARLRARFPLVGDQSPLLPAFRVNAAGCGGVDPAQGGFPIESNSSTDGGGASGGGSLGGPDPGGGGAERK